jgi:hypothetical protein
MKGNWEKIETVLVKLKARVGRFEVFCGGKLMRKLMKRSGNNEDEMEND